MVFRDQILVFRQAGALPAPAFEDLLKQVKELDMDEVRRRDRSRNESQAGGWPTSRDVLPPVVGRQPRRVTAPVPSVPA